MKNENLVKKTCKELGLTYKEFGELIGYTESAINSAARKERISRTLEKSIHMYKEILELKKELKEFENLKEILRK